MISVNTHDAKTHLSELILKVETRHEKVIICRNGKPVAQLLPWENQVNPLRQNAKLKKIIFNEDPRSPLSSDEWPMEQR